MTIEFELNGQKFIALNGGPHFKFNEAVSFVVHCKTQAELDYYWKKLSADGKEVQCGWLQDKYGLSWQIVPTIISELFASKDPAKSHSRDGSHAQNGQARHQKIERRLRG